jgi:hypothetical protein
MPEGLQGEKSPAFGDMTDVVALIDAREDPAKKHGPYKKGKIQTETLPVFAIPRTALFTTMTYVIEGTQFAVQECLHPEGSVCQVALIQGDCQFVRNAETCDTYMGGRRMSPRQGPVTYFIYNQSYGVILGPCR